MCVFCLFKNLNTNVKKEYFNHSVSNIPSSLSRLFICYFRLPSVFGILPFVFCLSRRDALGAVFPEGTPLAQSFPKGRPWLGLTSYFFPLQSSVLGLGTWVLGLNSSDLTLRTSDTPLLAAKSFIFH
jgi:hypothetical protein